MSSNLGGPGDTAGSTQIAPASPIADPPTSIQKLANELLGVVFETGARITLQDGGLPFIIAVSHVCQHWRAVAYTSSDAWCYIPVHLSRHAMTQLFLTRSEGRLLSVCLYSDDTIDTNSKDATEAMELVKPSAPRWTRLRIRGEVRHCYTPLMYLVANLTRLQGVVRLRAFELQVDDHRGSFVLPANLLGTPSPKLESVRCVGMAIQYQSPIFHGLTRLTLAHLCRPTHQEFRELCVRSPQLQYLQLENVFPTLVERDPQAWGPFVLNSLRTLEVVMDMETEDRVGYVERFFGALTVPVLCELSFQSKQQLAWESHGNTISDGGLVWDHVRTLHLVASGPVNFSFVANSAGLFRMFPKLEHFTFHAADDSSLLSFLYTWIYGPGVHTSPDKIWRQLKSLTIWTPQNKDKVAAGETVDESLDLLERLRLWNGQHFKLYVW